MINSTGQIILGETELPSDLTIFDNHKVRVLLVVLYTIVFFFCFLGNLTVLLVTSCNWKLRSVTKFCLSNLAFANLCVGIFCVYQNLSLYLYPGWVFGEFLCRMYHFTDSLSHTASIFILVVISIERYVVILHPFRCRQMLTIQRLRLIIIAVWILSALVSAPKLYYMTSVQSPFLPKVDDEYQEMCVPRVAVYNARTADMIQFITLFALPLTIISVLYGKVGLFLRRREICSSYFVCSVPSSSVSSASSATLMAANTHQNQFAHHHPPGNRPGPNPPQVLATPEERKLIMKNVLRASKRKNGSMKERKRVAKPEHSFASSSSPTSEGMPSMDGPPLNNGDDGGNHPPSEAQMKISTFMNPSTMIRIKFCRVDEATPTGGGGNRGGFGMDRSRGREENSKMGGASIEGGGASNGKIPAGTRYGRGHGALCKGNSSGGPCNGNSSGGPSNGNFSGGSCNGNFSGGSCNGNFSGGPCNGNCSGGPCNGNFSGGSSSRNGGGSYRGKSRTNGGSPLEYKRNIGGYQTNVTSSPSPHRAVARLLITIVLTFAICNLPFYLRKFYQNYYVWHHPIEDSAWTEIITPLTYLMMYANCAINPFLYGIMSKSFRSSFWSLVKCERNPPSLSIELTLP